MMIFIAVFTLNVRIPLTGSAGIVNTVALSVMHLGSSIYLHQHTDYAQTLIIRADTQTVPTAPACFRLSTWLKAARAQSNLGLKSIRVLAALAQKAQIVPGGMYQFTYLYQPTDS